MSDLSDIFDSVDVRLGGFSTVKECVRECEIVPWPVSCIRECRIQGAGTTLQFQFQQYDTWLRDPEGGSRSSAESILYTNYCILIL